MSDKKSNSFELLDKGNYLIKQFVDLQDNSNVEKMRKLQKQLEEYIAQFSDKKFENILHLMRD